jgi:hypothetical protein
MATDSIMGLFTTPEQYQQAQSQAALNRGVQLAQLDPLQRASAQLYQGGYLAGGAIGSALGAQDPMLKLQSMRQQAVQGMDPTDPKSILEAAQKLSQFDPTGASQLAQLARDAAAKGAETTLKLAQAKRAENFQAAQADAEKKRNIVATVEDRLSKGETVDPVEINKAKLAFGDISRPKTFQQADGTIVTVPPTVDSSMFPNIGKFMTGAGSAAGGKAGVITTPASEKAAAQAEQAQEDTVSSLKNGLVNIDKARNLSKSWTTNPWISSTTENLPTDAMALKDTVTALNSQKTIDLINRMKQQSKTGATGFGSITEKELDLLQSDIVKLNYRSPTFKADLKRVEDKWKEIINKIETDKAQKAAKETTPSGSGTTDLERASANVGGLQREISRLPANDPRRDVLQQELTKSQERVKYENRIKIAGERNKGMSRAEIISNLQKNKDASGNPALPSDYR